MADTLELRDSMPPKFQGLTYRESKYLAARIRGLDKAAAAKAAGFSHWQAKCPSQIETPEMIALYEQLKGELVENTLNAGLIDATEIHDYLTEALRADMRDIRNDDGSFKPQSEWPEIWGRMMEAGDVDVEYESVRSHDGEDTEGRGGWETGGIVRKVKLKFASRVKLLELAMKHKGVNAMVEQKAGDVNVLVVTAERAREIDGARRRMQRILKPAKEPAE